MAWREFFHYVHIGFTQFFLKSEFPEPNYHPATVGEAISLPRSTSPQKATTLGEFAEMSNTFSIQPNTQESKPSGRLIASSTVA